MPRARRGNVACVGQHSQPKSTGRCEPREKRFQYHFRTRPLCDQIPFQKYLNCFARYPTQDPGCLNSFCHVCDLAPKPVTVPVQLQVRCFPTPSHTGLPLFLRRRWQTHTCYCPPATVPPGWEPGSGQLGSWVNGPFHLLAPVFELNS